MEQKNIYAVIDLETTGSSYRKGHRIIQIGITLLQNDEIIQEYDFTVNPGHSIPPLIENLTGITNKQVKNAPYFEDIASYVYNLIENCIFVAHNIAFDYQFLNQAFIDADMPPLTLRGMDTVELTKILYPTLSSYRLSDLSKYFELTHLKVHNAAGDAHATAELFILLKNRAIHLPIVTLEKLCFLGKYTQRNNKLFFEKCLEISRNKKMPKSELITIKKGIALRTKQVDYEQTNYRAKEDMFIQSYQDSVFFENLGYRKRIDQLKMMEAIQSFFSDHHSHQLAIEAPTGIGKTFAYVFPAILAANPDRKIIISTSTLLLQEQILMQDLEKLKNKLPFPFQVASLLSKSHLLNLEKFFQLDLDVLSGTDALVVMSVYVWLTETETGDLSELSPGHQMGTVFDKIRYQKDDKDIDAEWKDQDYYLYSQLKAKQASVLVTNHSYLTHHFEDIKALYCKEMPYLIVDEAHRLPLVFQERKKVTVCLSSMKTKAERVSHDSKSYREYLEKNATDPFPLYELINFEFTMEKYYLSLEEVETFFINKINEHKKSSFNKKKNKEAELYLDFEEFEDFTLTRHLNKTKRLMDEVIFTGLRLLQSEDSSEDSLFDKRIVNYLNSIEKKQIKLTKIMENGDTFYRYLSYSLENDVHSIQLIQANFQTGEELQELLQEIFEKVLYISATLLLETNKEYFPNKIGVENLPSLTFHSKEWENQKEMKIFVPNDILPVPQVKKEDWIKLVCDFIIDLTKQTNKKTLLLFTSKEILEGVFTALKNHHSFEGSEVEILAQGFSGSRRRIHRRFSEAKRAVLLGAGTYWEGVDFPDQPVELLIVTRLPFNPPETALNLALKKYYKTINKNVFIQEYLPFMMIRFMQGVGRVARSEKEKGLVICLDSRFLHSSYSQKIQKMLPDYIQVEEYSLSNLIHEVKEYYEG